MSKPCKVAILGAAGGIALLLKQSPVITELALYDVGPLCVAVDISHINTPSVVTGYDRNDDGLRKALEGAHIVVIPAGVPRKPGMTRDDLFKINAGIVRDLAQAIANHCPKAFIAVISNPVNSTVPIVAEVLKKAGVFDAKRLNGVTTLDVVRASTFSAAAGQKPLESAKYKIPVIGGHSGATIIPILSQSQPPIQSDIDFEALVKRIQFGGDEVVAAKDGAGSATLSMAYAGARFVNSLIAAAWEGKSGVVEMSYINVKNVASVASMIGSDIDYFSVPVELGTAGVSKVLPIGELNHYEKQLLDNALPELKANISKVCSVVHRPLFLP
ncbi:putative MDH1-malate dehydrogenase precursor, mitochondrial [Atractiella rhizophila]|nr:putative MDH1-malate dehydrogenase precursor, mitochondrial [Atractiella rhizophila]